MLPKMHRELKHIILILLFSFLHASLFGQQSNTLYLMHEVPQSNRLNPAVQPACKWFVGFPMLSSAHFNISSSAYAFNDIFAVENSTANLQAENLYKNAQKSNLLSSELHLDLLSIGYRFGPYYIHFSVAEKINAAITYPGSMMELAWKGNSAFLDERVKLNNLHTHSGYYREYSLALSKRWNATNTFGLRGKLLFGKANAYSNKSSISFYTDPNTFNLNAKAKATLNTSFPMTVTQNNSGRITGVQIEDMDPGSFLLNNQNRGFAIDMGWIHKYSEAITLSASLLDVGFIRWKTNLNNIHVNGSFDYSGTGLDSDFNSTEYITALSDTIFEAFSQTVTQDSYISWLPVQVYLGAKYQYKPALAFGGVARSVLYRKKLHPSVTLSAQTTLWNNLSAAMSWSYINNTYKNLGAGLAWHSRNLQMHIVSDNILGFFSPLNTRTINLRFGIGFLLGCPGKGDTINRSSVTPSIIGGDCSWAQKWPKPYKKKLRQKKK